MGKNENAKGTQQITVIKEGDVYGTDYKFQLRKSSTQEDLLKFVEKFKDSPYFLSEFVKIETAE